MTNQLMKLIYYNQNSFIELKTYNDQYDLWSSTYCLRLISNDQNIIASNNKEDSRCVVYVGTLNDLITVVKLDYINDQSSVVVDFHEIKEDKIIKINTHVINSDFTIGNTMIKVNKVDDKFIIMWSDLFNYDYLQIANVNQTSFTSTIFLHESIYENNFEQLFATSTTSVNIVSAIGHTNNLTTIIISNVFHDFHHTGGSLECFQHNKNNTEFDLHVVDVLINGDIQYILTQIAIETQVDPLHLKLSTYYILFETEFTKFRMVEMIEKTNLKPSIAIIDGKPSIFPSKTLMGVDLK